MALTLKEQLKQECPLTDESFGRHESDLYVLAKPGVRKFLKRKGIMYSAFIAQDPNWQGHLAFDIPFAAMDEHVRARRR